MTGTGRGLLRYLGEPPNQKLQMTTGYTGRS